MPGLDQGQGQGQRQGQGQGLGCQTNLSYHFLLQVTITARTILDTECGRCGFKTVDHTEGHEHWAGSSSLRAVKEDVGTGIRSPRGGDDRRHQLETNCITLEWRN